MKKYIATLALIFASFFAFAQVSCCFVKKDGMQLLASNKTFVKSHAFANPSNPAYDKVATEEAWGLAINYFKARLK